MRGRVREATLLGDRWIDRHRMRDELANTLDGSDIGLPAPRSRNGSIAPLHREAGRFRVAAKCRKVLMGSSTCVARMTAPTRCCCVEGALWLPRAWIDTPVGLGQR